MNTDFSNIITSISEFIRGEGGTFDELAQELFAIQYERVHTYRRLCDLRGITPKNFRTIPAVPTTGFRDLEITSLLPIDRTTVFHSSGTTSNQPSRHYHNSESLALYEESITHWFNQHLQPNQRMLALTPPPSQAPHSSLAYMLQSVQSQEPCFTGNAEKDVWIVDIDATLQSLRKNEAPITLMGTAFSFVHLCDAIEPLKLPAGSCVMETGGYKGRSRELPKTQLHTLITTKLGVPPENIVCEYGMCELSSQAYDTVASQGGTRRFHFPHWVRARIVSPENGDEIPLGETGLLEVIDLANARSVLAVRTSDLAVRHEDGFELLGRAPQAEPRGCSLTTA